ncbi:hypothetical protein H6G81_09530 [Scytonema hofmannii FACHB-248]|uniref:Conjugal transfer protein n=1 Tax=Scytonema hofmannii FACHB-248 TaxID=1842502 RepID=A0ABR8GP82_9CYAN|nr:MULTISPECIES: hypothetical protein [Nostocales]MBD2604761.1 hypothetical protein [Scytonema hofmannii FACHB-248]
MEPNKSKFRTVNATLGKQPNIGPFPADQLIPWAVICGISYYLCHGLLKLNWIWTCAVAAWGISTWWVLTGSRAWRFLAKFVLTPNWTRVRVPYQRMLQLNNYSAPKKVKKVKKTRR